MDKFLHIPNFPGYAYDPEIKVVQNVKTGKILSFKERGERRIFRLRRYGKKLEIIDYKLRHLVSGTKFQDVPGVPVEGFPNYTVTQTGDVFNRKTGRKMGTGKQKCKKVKLTRTLTPKSKLISVHHLVARAFLPNKQNLPEIRHKNGDKQDNRIENLEWAQHHNKRPTRKIQQVQTTFLFGEEKSFSSISEANKETGISTYRINSSCKTGKVTRDFLWRYLPTSTRRRPVKLTKVTCTQENIIKEYRTLKEASRAIYAHPNNIADVCNGKLKSFGGYKWRYPDSSPSQPSTEWRMLPNFSRYKISRKGKVYSLRLSRELSGLNNRMRLKGDDGKYQTFFPNTLIKRTFPP